MDDEDPRSDEEKAAEVDRILEEAGITEDDSDESDAVIIVAPLRRRREQP
jgi:hypothetical protein